jgi:hypothetical protein
MPPRPEPPVRTATVRLPARMPEVMKAFSPSTTKWSPSCRAVVRRLATSDPAPGSVTASAAIFSPARTGGTTFRFNASEPNLMIAGSPIVWLISEAHTPPEPLRASSWLRMIA